MPFSTLLLDENQGTRPQIRLSNRVYYQHWQRPTARSPTYSSSFGADERSYCAWYLMPG